MIGMLKIFRNKARKNKEKNTIVIGGEGTGMVRTYTKPLIPQVTGEDLLNLLLIDGKYAGYNTVFSNDKIYIALQKIKRFIYAPYSDYSPHPKGWEVHSLKKSTFLQ